MKRAASGAASRTGLGLLIVSIVVLASPARAQTGERFDIVLAGGRVLDPETGLDAVRNIGIRGDRIDAISEGPLTGAVVIDVSGLVVAPGFVDLHGQGNAANAYQARDGVTTALELEGGVGDVETFIKERRGDSILNFGVSVSHSFNRVWAMPGRATETARLDELFASGSASTAAVRELVRAMGRTGYDPIDRQAIGGLRDRFARGLRAGGLGLGVPHQYYPGADYDEIFRVFEMAADWDVPIYTHVRSMDVEAFQEVIANAAVTGAPLHIVHVNSSALSDMATVLDIIGAAQARGLDITTESYPYTAGAANISSALFDEGWQELLGISYGDLQWVATGERLTEETFNKYRAEGGIVIDHLMKPEWIELAMRTPFVMVASDGLQYSPEAHPRSAGTFSRFLGYYVRELELLPLIEAVGKISLMPAQRLQEVAPMMARKGRLQVGADADITVFAPGDIIDTATFEDDLSFSEGVEHVLVNGTFVVRDGENVAAARPGRPVLGKMYAGSDEEPGSLHRETP